MKRRRLADDELVVAAYTLAHKHPDMTGGEPDFWTWFFILKHERENPEWRKRDRTHVIEKVGVPVSAAEEIIWRSIVTPIVVHAFRGKVTRGAVCGRRDRKTWGWTLADRGAERCNRCARLLAEEGWKS